MQNSNFQEFLHQTKFEDLPQAVLNSAKRSMLDLTGVLVAGSKTRLTEIISGHVVNQFAAGGNSASLMLNGAQASPVGAALANGMMIDSIDAHDGYKEAKGTLGATFFQRF